MSEAMAVETIIEGFWQLQGFWTKIRVPFKISRGWSDIDVLAYNPESKILVISESKAQGSKRDVYPYTLKIRKKCDNIMEYDKGDEHEGYFKFLKHIDKICSNGFVFKNFSQMVSKIIIQLVSNYYFTDDVMPLVKNDVLKFAKKILSFEIDIEVRLDTHVDLFFEIVKLESNNPQEKRYGHCVIDIARELNRFLKPDIKYAGEEKAELRNKIMSKIDKIWAENKK